MNKSFGEALVEQIERYRFPKDSRYVKWFQIYPLPINGCSDNEISEIARKQNISLLPEIYIEFMRYAGKDSGDIFIGYDLTYRYVSRTNMKKLANKILEKDGKSLLGDIAFVFMNLQGHSFWYFLVNQGDDPPVYLYMMDDGEDDPEYPCKSGSIEVAAHLSEFFTQFIAERASDDEQQKFINQYALSYRTNNSE